MSEDQNAIIKSRIDRIKQLASDHLGGFEWLEAGGLALTVIHETVGGSHPLYSILEMALKKGESASALSASRGVVTLYECGGLKSPRLAIAHEIEGSLLDIASTQVQSAEQNGDSNQKQIQLALAAFLAGATLEDALRRICDSHGITYDSQHSTISKLQTALYQPSKGIEVISSSENKQITAWGDTRNKADHGKFTEITYAEALSMVIGVRTFIDKHLP